MKYYKGNVSQYIEEYPTKHNQGFTNDELEELVGTLHIDSRRFYHLISMSSCIIINSEYITSREEVLRVVKILIDRTIS